MRSIYLLILGFYFSMDMFSQKQEIDIEMTRLPDLVKNMADTFRTKFPYSYSYFYVEAGDSFSYEIKYNPKSFVIRLPTVENILISRKIFIVLDSLARTNNYCNKLLASQSFNVLLKGCQIKEDSLLLHKRGNEEVRILIEDIINSNFDNCARYIGLSFLDNISKKDITPKIIMKLRDLLKNPYHTLGEAKVLAQKEEPLYFNYDTTGYNKKKKRRSELNEKEQSEISNIDYMLFLAKKAGMSFGNYLDSLRLIGNSQLIHKYLNLEIESLSKIVSNAGYFYLYELAPDIETVYFKHQDMEWVKECCPINLARLEYKNYDDSLILSYSQGIETTIRYLNNPNLVYKQKKNAIGDLFYYFNGLKYINTQASYYASAPLLLVTEKEYYYSDYDSPKYIVGAKFFLELDGCIENLPWDRGEQRNLALNGPIGYINEFYIEKYMPKDFLEKIYKWMIENKGMYKIVKNE
jgi:hypothetical protein